MANYIAMVEHLGWSGRLVLAVGRSKLTGNARLTGPQGDLMGLGFSGPVVAGPLGIVEFAGGSSRLVAGRLLGAELSGSVNPEGTEAVGELRLTLNGDPVAVIPFTAYPPQADEVMDLVPSPGGGIAGGVVAPVVDGAGAAVEKATELWDAIPRPLKWGATLVAGAVLLDRLRK